MSSSPQQLESAGQPIQINDSSNNGDSLEEDTRDNDARDNDAITTAESNTNSSPISPQGPIRVPGTYPPEWLPDNDTDSCMACDSPFTLIKRRHHCRSCGKIFCADCCKQKAKLLYLDNKEARVCGNCYQLLEYTLPTSTGHHGNQSIVSAQVPPLMEVQASNSSVQQSSHGTRVHGVLKNANQSRPSNNECNISTSSSSSEQFGKQVIFSDGIRPGTDLSESSPYMASTSSSNNASTSAFSLLSRQSGSSEIDSRSSSRRSKQKHDDIGRNITVCDELGYLPPVVIHKNSAIACSCEYSSTSSTDSITNMIANQFRLSGFKKSIQASMESRNCPLNAIIKFDQISDLVGIDGVVTLLLLKDFYLKVKLTHKECCMGYIERESHQINEDDQKDDDKIQETNNIEPREKSIPEYWCFASDGLAKFGQNEVVLVIDKDKSDSCIPRDVFKMFLTLHELSLRRQSIENLGNLLFQDGLFGNRDTAGLLFVQPLEDHCLNNLILPKKTFLVALLLQRWEVPWSKVFPMRLLLRLGHKYNTYPYPVVSFRLRDPVYYEVGHTIISILGDFRNFRYSITHVEGLKVTFNKKTRKVFVQLHQSSYQQFNKVLDSSNNEHVLAWSCSPPPEGHGHLVSIQNEDGQYETVEFYKKGSGEEDLECGSTLGVSFIIFSGALKLNQTGQPAKISIVEDGLLIQIQSCTMSALKNAIHFMHHFDIDCENNQDLLNRVEIDWQLENT